MAYLVITGNDAKRFTRQITEDAALRIGRSSRNDIVLPDLALSRHHAEVVPEGEGWVLKDAGSRNGTFLNGQRVSGQSPLRPGDRITLGGCTLQFHTDPESEERVIFSNEPVASEGTVIMALNDVMTMPDASPLIPEQKRTAEDYESQRRRYEIIEKANMELLAHEPLEVLMPKALDLVNRAVKPDRTALLLEENDGSLVCRAFRGDGSAREMSISNTIARMVMDQHVSILTSDAQTDDRFREGASILSQGIHSVMAVPLWNNKEVIGLIYTDSRLTSGLFSDEDLRLLTMLANVAAIQIENSRLFEERLEKQRFEQEAKAAADIQRRLLPSAPLTISGYTVEGFNTPCFEVGGDYYDYLTFDATTHGIVVADVAGKGMPAAMLMAGLQATFRARATGSPDVGELIGHLNDSVLLTSPSNRFVTLFFIYLDESTHTMRFINAGHAPGPIVVRASGKVEVLEASAVPLGIMPDVDFPVGELAFEPGDFVFMCSDGVTDTVDPSGEGYGEERLAELLASLAGQSPVAIRQRVEEELETHAKGTPQPDDLTMVVLQRSP